MGGLKWVVDSSGSGWVGSSAPGGRGRLEWDHADFPSRRSAPKPPPASAVVVATPVQLRIQVLLFDIPFIFFSSRRRRLTPLRFLLGLRATPSPAQPPPTTPSLQDPGSRSAFSTPSPIFSSVAQHHPLPLLISFPFLARVGAHAVVRRCHIALLPVLL